jgi:hypothetical protein
MSRGADAIALLRESWRRWINARRAMAELANRRRDEVHRIAACGHPGPSELLPQRLEQLGLDPEFVRRAEPETYTDLTRTCASCADWRRCKHDLARGDVQAGMGDYCLNTPTIDALTVESHAH